MSYFQLLRAPSSTSHKRHYVKPLKFWSSFRVVLSGFFVRYLIYLDLLKQRRGCADRVLARRIKYSERRRFSRPECSTCFRSARLSASSRQSCYRVAPTATSRKSRPVVRGPSGPAEAERRCGVLRRRCFGAISQVECDLFNYRMATSC